MNAEAIYRPERQGFDLLLYEQSVTGAITAYTLDEGRFEPHDVAQGASMPVFLHLPRDVFKAMVGAGVDYLPPSAATDAALKDTREVRDRLLGMVEQAFPLNLIAPREGQ